MLFNLNIQLLAEFNPQTETLEVKDFKLLKQEKVTDKSEPYRKKHLINATQERYSILTFGKTMPFPLNQVLTLVVEDDSNDNPKTYQIKSHSSIKGRLDGLRQTYLEHPSVLAVDEYCDAVYDIDSNVLTIKKAEK